MSSEIVTRVVRTWNGAPRLMQQTSIHDLDALQRRFRGRLEIIPQSNGGVQIFPDSAGDQTEFDAFMAKYTDFTPQTMRV